MQETLCLRAKSSLRARVPWLAAGTSAYQAAWIVDSEGEDDGTGSEGPSEDGMAGMMEAEGGDGRWSDGGDEEVPDLVDNEDAGACRPGLCAGVCLRKCGVCLLAVGLHDQLSRVCCLKGRPLSVHMRKQTHTHTHMPMFARALCRLGPKGTPWALAQGQLAQGLLLAGLLLAGLLLAAPAGTASECCLRG